MEASRVGIARDKFGRGYNCSQAVVCTYCDLLGMDEKIAFRAAEGYGLGLGIMETCGSVCAMVFLAGLKNSDGDLELPTTQFETFALGKEMAERFRNLNGSILCREIRGEEGVSKPLRSCIGSVIDCAKIVEDVLFPGQFLPYDGPME